MNPTEPLPHTRQAAIAHGIAAYETMRWLHGRPIRRVSLHRDIEYPDDPIAGDHEATREHVRLLMTPATAEMIHLGASTQHISAERDEIQRAQILACQLPGDCDPTNHLEAELDAICATLTSPKVWRAVGALAGALLKRRALDAGEVKALIEKAIGIGPAPAGARGATAGVQKRSVRRQSSQ